MSDTPTLDNLPDRPTWQMHPASFLTALLLEKYDLELWGWYVRYLSLITKDESRTLIWVFEDKVSSNLEELDCIHAHDPEFFIKLEEKLFLEKK